MPISPAARIVQDTVGILIVLGFGWNITLRRRVRARTAELAASEEKFRLAFDNANTGMCLVDLQGHLLQVNDKMSEIFGYSRSELEQMTVNDLANMSHDLRTPLTAIMGYGELLQEEPGTQQRQQYLAVIQRNGHALLQLINDILDLSRIEAQKLTVERRACDLRQVVGEVLSVLQVRASPTT